MVEKPPTITLLKIMEMPAFRTSKQRFFIVNHVTDFTLNLILQ